MTQLQSYCGRSQELDNILNTSQSNVQFYSNWFPHRDHNKVESEASLLSTGHHRPDPAQRQTQMTTRLNSFETYWETRTTVWMTLRQSQKECRRCTAIRTEKSTLQWSQRSTSSKERTNLSESERLQSKQTVQKWDSSRRITRTLTKLQWADYDEDSSLRSSHCPQRMENLTAWKSDSTMSQIQKSSQMARRLNSNSPINTKSSQEKHLNKAVWKTTCDYGYLSWPKQRYVTNQSRTWMINTLPCLGSGQNPTGLGSQMDNVHTAEDPKTHHSGVRSIHAPTSPLHLLLQAKENKSTAHRSWTVSIQSTRLRLSICCLAAENAQIAVWIAVIGFKDVDGNIRGNINSFNFIKAKGWLREPESTQVKSILVQNGRFRFITHCPWSPDTRQAWRISMKMSTHQL